jgi:Fic family protein
MRTVKRKIGNEGFYYLKHSFRKGSSVITREKYLGKALPANLEEQKKELLEECNKQSLFEILGKIKKGVDKEWKTFPESVKAKMKEELAVDFTYNTNAIEGSKITKDETREIVEHSIAPNRPLRDIKETEAHVKVFLNMLNKPEALNIKLVLRWHKELFCETKQDIAGKFREHLVRVADYRAPDWQDVVKLMVELIKFYAASRHMHPVELAARMHYRFEKIHPFGDGNGRVGRLLMNYIMWHNGYPPLVIEYKKRKSYYTALSRDENKFFNYFTRRYIKAHSRYVKNDE